MTMKELASKIAKLEGKKSNVLVGDIREVLSLLSDLMVDDALEVAMTLKKNGLKRAKKKA